MPQDQRAIALFKEASYSLFPFLSGRKLFKKQAATSDPSTGQSDAEPVDMANQLFYYLAPAVLSSSQIPSASSCQSPNHSHCPPSGKVLVCGRRREMEDMATIVPSFFQQHHDSSKRFLRMAEVEVKPASDLHFFAVYDGHGGSQASKFCMERLHHVLAEELSAALPRAKEFNKEPSEGSTAFCMWEKAMASCFSKMDREVGGVCPNGHCWDMDRVATCCWDSIAPGSVGTTAIVAVVSSCQIVVANCGDSRAVLCRGGKVVPLPRDHKPDRNDEADRIEAAGGQVLNWNGNRVGGLLAVSRSIGDRYLKQYVVSEPEVTCMERWKEDECLILASDGLWDVISSDTAGEIVRKRLESSRNKRVAGSFLLGEDPASTSAAALLVKLAYSRGSKDNISVVIVDLKV
ncbi:hypothetical protein GOP47_0026672 [Adiantum capillus-veneris]|nr:hypothetical protein GOP47_0026672 [Adiantum capillus-veneris]